MPIYKDENRETYYVNVSYTDKFGKRKYHTKRGFKKYGDALKHKEQFFKNIESGEPITGLPFSFLADDYFKWYSNRRKPSSIKTIKNYLVNHITPFFQNIDVHEMDAHSITEFHDHMLNKEHNGKKYRKGYIQDVHTCLSSVLKHGMKFYEVKVNVASLAGNIENDEYTEWDYYTLNEFNYFYNLIEDIYDKAFFKLLFYSGLRKGEQRALTWKDVNFIEGYVDINKNNYNGKVGTPKTKSSRRKVFLPDHVMQVLMEYKDWYKNNNVFKDDYVVFGKFYQSIGEKQVDVRYHKILDNTDELKAIKIHEFRHSHASDCINRLNMDRDTLRKRLGHSSTATIEKYYGHLYPSTEKSAILNL
ncbi:tyrosine-type recombinase/integrase [Jeotgalicoccus sp. FSL K6-3177]|uniref:tyrosine-type recombinase/integrase n=1 Tax=Jeotgalicoccus sp. FSL K6-3177 TaxID=2921494 RepID=UPI0030FDD965